MNDIQEDVQLTKVETILMLGIIGCLLFATWEIGHLLSDEWLRDWVAVNRFVRRRVILYGIAFFMSISSVFFSIKYTYSTNRFIQVINRAFLWYGTLLLISTIAIFVFDCLPEVFAGVMGAVIFIAAIYIIQKKHFTKARMISKRIEKGRCFSCDTLLPPNAIYCPHCKEKVGTKCSKCNSYLSINDNYCSACGEKNSDRKI